MSAEIVAFPLPRPDTATRDRRTVRAKAILSALRKPPAFDRHVNRARIDHFKEKFMEEPKISKWIEIFERGDEHTWRLSASCYCALIELLQEKNELPTTLNI